VPNTAHVLQILTLALAVKKMSNILSDPFPVLDSTNSAPDANTNGRPLSLAIARASNVFPVPGGPLIKIPCQSLKSRFHQACIEAKKSPIRKLQTNPSQAKNQRETTYKIARKCYLENWHKKPLKMTKENSRAIKFEDKTSTRGSLTFWL
jgi:hypothetical protein